MAGFFGWSSGDWGNWLRRKSMKRRERGRPLVRSKPIRVKKNQEIENFGVLEANGTGAFGLLLFLTSEMKAINAA